MRTSTSILVILASLALSVFLAGPADALDPGRRAPEISLQDMSGNPVQLSALRGKVVVVDFWASWCQPCRRAMPELDSLYQRYKDQGLVVVGVNVDGEERAARQFLRRTRVSFPVVHDRGQQVAGRYQPPRMPSTFIIDKRGIVRHVHAGYRNGDLRRIEQTIQGLL